VSRVYFHSPSGEAELRGSERAYAGCLVDRLALACLDPDGFDMRERLLPLVPLTSYLHAVKAEHFPRSFETWWGRHPLRAHPRWGDVPYDTFTMSLNTAVVMGSDTIELLARLHGTCEIHGYVEGEHREWLAEIIDEGRETKVLRPDQGWEDVAALLRSRGDEPVVMSYSVCDQFPDAALAIAAGTWSAPEGDEDHDAWYNLTAEEQWRLAMDGLRRTGEGSVDVHPEMWGIRGFGDPVLTVFDLVESLYAATPPAGTPPPAS